MKFKEFEKLNMPSIEEEILNWWQEHQIFEQSHKAREGKQAFVFYEGPPSANGMPGIHHVMARTIKDLFCRYKTMKGYHVHRKSGWDTHGLPVELSVEKSLGITKDDIGQKISVAEYNATCRKEVMKYKDVWEDLTRRMGYWVDLDNPYITFENEYIETLWALLRKLFDKGLLYKGYTIQPYSPAAGTGLSSHELNLPGSYREVKDTTVIAQFKIAGTENDYLLAWTTTPWTLPSNTALAVGKKIRYALVHTLNPYTKKPIRVYLAEQLISKYFAESAGFTEGVVSQYQPDQKLIPYRICGYLTGNELAGLSYEQLMPYATPDDGDAFKVVLGDFVTTEDGTGIVHIAPSFGADDLRTAQQHGLGSLTLVDSHGQFVDVVTDFAGRYVKNYTDDPEYEPVDVDIAVKLKTENKAFKIEKYIHSYPHCWRTDKPVIYYPMNSWFVKTTALKERMAELNKTINWQPPFTGAKRFGNWLENLVDWNLSRTRYWGTPLPIWMDEKGEEIKCIGSIDELRMEVNKSVNAGFMDKPLTDDFDLHRPYVDDVVLVSEKGNKMYREPDLIDVWFDSGAMPYAQYHYPFGDPMQFEENFPADFIAEGVDQTRGWFFTLHAIATMISDSVAFRNVVSNGLVLDKNGNKMSKRLGNAVDPFETISKYSADATRWYMMVNSQPWDNLKFDEAGIQEVKRKFFGTLYNTYSFFALYANIDGFDYNEPELPIEKRPEIDKWIISLLHSLIRKTDGHYNSYEPTKAGRAIQEFVTDHLSNWYVRLCRRRFWKGDYSDDKISAYQTLYQCLETICHLMAPIAPFITEKLYTSLNTVTHKQAFESVHLAKFPESNSAYIDTNLEQRMQMAQDISSMVLSIRKKENIKVRQPLNKIMVPVLDAKIEAQIEKVKPLILSEVNVKELEYVRDTTGMITKKIKPDFRALGPKLGKHMKAAIAQINSLEQEAIGHLEKTGSVSIVLDGSTIEIDKEDLEIITEDIPGWQVASIGDLTVALDISITNELKEEGYARELVNKIQKHRKDSRFNVTDRIHLHIERNDELLDTLKHYKDYICNETLAAQLNIISNINDGITIDINDIQLTIAIEVVK